jgi:hypothetical protein
MLIECLTKREGITPIDIEKIKYNFIPIPVIDPDTNKPVPGPTTSFAEISNEEHVKFLMDPKRGGRFVPYDPKPRYSKPPKNPMAGYAITRYGENTGNPGYVVGKPDGKEYAGSDGVWKKAKDTGVPPNGLAPFRTEIDAFTWLQEELGVGV